MENMRDKKIYFPQSFNEQMSQIDGVKIHPIHYALVKGIEKEKVLN